MYRGQKVVIHRFPVCEECKEGEANENTKEA